MENLLLSVSGMNEYVVLGIAAFVVFLVVRTLNFFGYLSTGTMKRIGVLVGSAVTSNMLCEAEKVLSAVVIGLLSVGFNELVTFIGKVKISKKA